MFSFGVFFFRQKKTTFFVIEWVSTRLNSYISLGNTTIAIESYKWKNRENTQKKKKKHRSADDDEDDGQDMWDFRHRIGVDVLCIIHFVIYISTRLMDNDE